MRYQVNHAGCQFGTAIRLKMRSQVNRLRKLKLNDIIEVNYMLRLHPQRSESRGRLALHYSSAWGNPAATGVIEKSRLRVM